ncbi:hypothetical protein [Brucella sp. 2280]|uniref:hypothetical protein n=1 Tax=Brucella sp. 2280 TaxID=2592625 RepID=UPI001295B3C5|nr:hypothetical protein [Brucella sp. 2280]QGA58252.1 hypothetical protein GHC20_14460 [Brucella sp. 2280]
MPVQEVKDNIAKEIGVLVIKLHELEYENAALKAQITQLSRVPAPQNAEEDSALKAFADHG